MRIALLTIIACILPVATLAHADGEKVETESHFIEYALIPEEGTAEKQQNVQITIEDKETFEPVFDVPLWIRVTSPSGVIFSSDDFVTNSAGPLSVSFYPYEAGDYEVAVELTDTGEKSTFPLVIGGGDTIVKNTEFTDVEDDVVENQEEAESEISEAVWYLLIIGLGIFVAVLFAILGRQRSERHD